jgi:HSP20 family protein
MGETYGPYIDPGHFLGRSALGSPWHNEAPLANILHRDGECIFEIAIPGFEKEDISVSLEKDILTISGRSKRTEDKLDYVSCEFNLHPFQVQFRVTESFELDNMQAIYKNGILRLYFKESSVPKDTQIRKIEVQ